MKKSLLFSLSGCLLLALTITSCNKDFEKLLPERDHQDTATVAYGSPKVLYIIADGARGLSVRDANVPNIKSLLPHSIYSWVSISDPDLTTEVNNWADMLTGVKKNKHQVLDDNLSNSQLERFPVVFKRVKESNPNLKTAAFSSSEVFNQNFTAGVDDKNFTSTDEGVKNAVVNSLSTDTASFILAHFTEIDKTGEQFGYDNSFPEYKSSIERFDGYVGEILTALKARPNYKDENWLVIVCSSTGGSYNLPPNLNDNTIFSNTRANTFLIYHNPKYNPKIIVKPYTGNRFIGNAVRLHGREGGVRAQVPNAEIYNFSDTTQFTIELKVKKNPGSRGDHIQNYPSILGKMQEWSSNHPTDREKGWNIFLEEAFWMVHVRGSNGTHGQTRGADLGRGTWNHIAVKCERRSNKRYLRTYTDGKYFGEMEVTNWGSFTNNEPLTLGFIPGNGHGEPDVQIADVRIWLTALPDATINTFSCETYIDEGHPYYNYLAGYWPGTDGQGDLIKDLGPLQNHFVLQGNYQWQPFSDLICSPPSGALASFVPQNADIPAQILSWLRVPRRESWDLDGRVWLDQ